MDFVEWIENELSKREWSRSDLAKRGDITPAQVTRVLNREQNPGDVFFKGIAKAFGVPVEDVLRHAGILPPSPEPERVKRAQAIANRIATFRPDLQDLAEDFVNMLFERNKREKNGRSKQQ